MRQRFRPFRTRSMARRPGDEDSLPLSPRARRYGGWIAAALLVGGIALVFRVLGGNGDGTVVDPTPSGSSASSAATAITFGTVLDAATGEVAADARSARFAEGDPFVYSVPPSGTVPAAVYVEVRRTSGGTLETAAAFRVLLRELRGTLGSDAKSIGDLVVPVTGSSGKLFDLAKALGCREMFPVPNGVGGRFSVLSAVGLLPGALLGLDIEKMLKGAAAVNEHFRSAAPDENIVLQNVGVCHLMEEAGYDVRLLVTWGKKLESFGLWYDQLLAESLGKHERGALPLTIVNTRDLHSRGQQLQEGKRDKLVTNLIVERSLCDPLTIGRSEMDQDKLNELAAKTLPDVMSAAIAGTNKAYRDDSRPTANIRVPRLDEYTLGQLFQMMMLATVVEGRLIGINPYGQPGVEAYKKNMNAILRGDR